MRCVEKIELVPQRNSDGTIALRAVVLTPVERVRRLLRRIISGR